MDIRVVSPFPAAAVPRVWTWIQEFRGRVSDDFGAKSLADFVECWEAREQQTWAVYRGDEIGGVITFERLSPIAGTAHCVFKKSFWGRKTTLPATSEVARQIFAQGVEKLVFCVFEDNHAIRSLLRDLGAKQEGVLRKQTIRNGQRTDVIVTRINSETLSRCPCSSTAKICARCNCCSDMRRSRQRRSTTRRS